MGNRNESYVPLLCDYPDSEKINKVSEGAEAMFCRLLAKCDDAGNYVGSPKRLLGKLFTLRYENGTMTAHKVLRYCNELVTATLLTRYIVGGVEYIHINNCKKSLRNDVATKIFYPDFTQDTTVTELTDPVTESYRTRNEDVTPIQSNPIQSNPNQTNPAELSHSAFDQFWENYPRKTGKGAARVAFTKLNPDNEFLEKILTTVEQQKKSEQWQKSKGQFVPLPTTWLNQERWDDTLQEKEGEQTKASTVASCLVCRNSFHTDSSNVKGGIDPKGHKIYLCCECSPAISGKWAHLPKATIEKIVLEAKARWRNPPKFHKDSELVLSDKRQKAMTKLKESEE